MNDQALISESETLLRVLLDSWNSKYKYTILFNSMTENIVFFDTEWCEPPTEMKPVPNFIIILHFSLQYERKSENPLMIMPKFAPSVFPCVIPPLTKGVPHITWRIQHQETVFYDLSGVDVHIGREMTFQTQFFQNFALHYDNRSMFQTRLTHKSDITEIEDLGVQEVVVGKSAGFGMYLISPKLKTDLLKAQNKPDIDTIGSINCLHYIDITRKIQTEHGYYTNTYSANHVAITTYDLVQVFLATYRTVETANGLSNRVTGETKAKYTLSDLLVREETQLDVSTLVPITLVVDGTLQLLQTLQSMIVSRKLYDVTLQQSLETSRLRLRGNPALHEAFGLDLLKLDTEEKGLLDEETMVKFLAGLPIQLDKEEVKDILAQLPQKDKQYNYLVLQSSYEKILRNTFTNQEMQALSTDVTREILAQLQKDLTDDVLYNAVKQLVGQGIVDANPNNLKSTAGVLATLQGMEKISMPQNQVFGILRASGATSEELHLVLHWDNDRQVVEVNTECLVAHPATHGMKELEEKEMNAFDRVLPTVQPGLGVVDISNLSKIVSLIIYLLNPDLLPTDTQLKNRLTAMNLI